MADPQEKLNVLVLWPFWLWQTKQSPARRHYIRAIGKRTDVSLVLSGPGFHNWDANKTGCQNINSLMRNCHAVMGYKLAGTEKSPPIKNLEEVSKNFLTIESFNECWAGTNPDVPGEMHKGAPTVSSECIKSHLGLAILHHANDIPRLKAAEDFGTKVVHIPHGADPDFFSPKPWDQRRGVLLTGVYGGEHYPLRGRWESLLRRHKIPGEIFPRPSNYVKGWQQAEILVKQYGEALSRCRVKLGCSSRWRYALNHFSEAGNSGCIQVSDLPLGVEPGFHDMILPVNAGDPDNVLISTVLQALENAESLGNRAYSAASQYTVDNYAARFVSVIREILR